jgi:membrane fusion protein (multidrug efflux system)
MRSIMAALLAALVLPCAITLAQPGPMALPVKTAPVIQDTVIAEITALGTLRSDEAIIVRPEIAGRVQTIHFQEGQLVNKNDPLFTLDPAEYKAQLDGGAAQSRLEQLNFERTQTLYSRQLTSRQNLDEAQARLDAARAYQAKDQVRLDKTVIRAPFSGVVGLRQVSPGAYVSPGEDLTTLGSIGTVKLDFQVPEIYLSKIKVGQSLTIGVDAYPGRTFPGTVYAINSGIDEETRTIRLRARAPTPDNLLRSGMFARVALILEKRDKALLAPEQAIVPQGQKAFVFRVVDNKAVLTPVTLGQRRPGQVEITAGLNPKDQVVTDGQIKLRDGMAVQVLPPAAPAKAEK